MPGVVQTIDLRDFGSWAQDYADEVARLDFGPLLKVFAVMLSAEAKGRFDTGTAPDGTPWAPLARPRSGKRHKNSTPLPLRDTGLLMASMSDRGAQGHVEDVTSTSLEHGSALDRAGWHQDGTKFIPARPFAGVSEQTEDDIAEMTGDFVADALGGSS